MLYLPLHPLGVLLPSANPTKCNRDVNCERAKLAKTGNACVGQVACNLTREVDFERAQLDKQATPVFVGQVACNLTKDCDYEWAKPTKTSNAWPP